MHWTLNCSHECQRVKCAAVWGVVIVASSAGGRETGPAIHGHRAVSLANLEMRFGDSLRPGLFDEVVQQQATDPAPLVAGVDREQQELGLVGDAARKRKADRASGVAISPKCFWTAP